MYHALLRTRLRPFLVVQQRLSTSNRCIYSHRVDRSFLGSIAASRRFSHSFADPLPTTPFRTTRRFSGLARHDLSSLHEETISACAVEENVHSVTINTKEAKLELLEKYVDENVKEIIAKYDGVVDSMVSQSKQGPNPLQSREGFTLRERWQQEVNKKSRYSTQEEKACSTNHHDTNAYGLGHVVWPSDGDKLFDKLNESMDILKSSSFPVPVLSNNLELDDDAWNPSNVPKSSIGNETPAAVGIESPQSPSPDLPPNVQYSIETLNFDILDYDLSQQPPQESMFQPKAKDHLAGGGAHSLGGNNKENTPSSSLEGEGNHMSSQQGLTVEQDELECFHVNGPSLSFNKPRDDPMAMDVGVFGEHRFDSGRWKGKAMALLTVMRKEGWSLYDNHKYDIADHELRMDGDLAETGDSGAAPSGMVVDATENAGLEDIPWLTIESLLDDAELGEVALTTEEYNMILLAVATSTSTFHHRMVDILMKAYTQMKEFSECEEGVKPPNADTYHILLNVLESRGHCRDGALEVCSQIMKKPDVWTRDIITKVVRCYERNNKAVLGQQFLQLVVDNKKHPSRDAFLSQVRSFKRANMIQEALELLDVCIKLNGYDDSRGVDDVVVEVLSWRDGASSLPNRLVVQAVSDKINSLDQSTYYSPGWRVWKQITSSLGRLAQYNPGAADWESVRKATKTLLGEVKYTPQLDILSIGLAASEALRDSQLAVNLLHRVTAGDSQPSDAFTTPGEGLRQRRRGTTAPPDAFRKAIDICFAAGDVENCFVLLNQLSYSIPDSGQAEFYAMMIKGCVANKSPERALEVISRMREKGFVTREEDYGTVMAGFVKAGKRQEALQIFESMAAGNYGDQVVPGVNVYNAVLMSHVISGEWQEALSVYETICNLNIAPDKTTLQGLLIACNRLGDKARTLDLVKTLVESNMSMDQQCFEHCMKILLPKQVRATSVGEVRTRLRAYGIKNARFKEACTQLGRSLRIAELEEDRQATERLSQRDMKERREKAWRDVLEHMLEFSKLLQTGSPEQQPEFPFRKSEEDSRVMND